MRSELEKLERDGALGLAEQSAQRFGQVDQSLRSHAEVTHALSQSAQALREAMASPTARGQWGERMAEDVLRLAGFVENVNYVKQTQLDGATGRPDFTFPLPKGHELYMDVKFPMAGYLRFLDATDGYRAPDPPRRLPARRAGPGPRAGTARLRPGVGSPVGRLRADVPPQRAADGLHPRARPGA